MGRHAALPRAEHEVQPRRCIAARAGPRAGGAGADRAIAIAARDRLRRDLLRGRGRACARAARRRAASRTTTARRTARARGAAWRPAETGESAARAARANGTTSIDAFRRALRRRRLLRERRRTRRPAPARQTRRRSPAAAGGGVLTASYEARPFGVRSAMPLYKARAPVPQLVVVPPDMAEVPRRLARDLRDFGGAAARVEGLSLDEAFVELATAPDSTTRENVAAAIRARSLVGDRADGQRRRRDRKDDREDRVGLVQARRPAARSRPAKRPPFSRRCRSGASVGHRSEDAARA